MKKVLSIIMSLCLTANLAVFALAWFIMLPIKDDDNRSQDLFADYYDQAREILVTMSLDEKVGQMFLVRMPEEDEILQEITDEAPGGYILFAKDFRDETKESLAEKLASYQAESKISLIFGVDEEGGSVVRVSMFKEFRDSKFLSPQELVKRGGAEAVVADSHEKSELLKSLGLNMNLAPVADVPAEPDSFMYARSYGESAEETAKYIAEVVEAMKQENVISALKHFPGYGDNADTHTGIAIDNRSYGSLKSADLLPFVSGIQVGAPCILMSHNIVTQIDANVPASLSRRLHEILRNDLDFSGVIVTDDLAMGAIQEYSQHGNAAIEAVLAGNDLIISSDFTKEKQEVRSAVERGKIPEEYIDLAVQRILAMKLAYGIIE